VKRYGKKGDNRADYADHTGGEELERGDEKNTSQGIATKKKLRKRDHLK